MKSNNLQLVELSIARERAVLIPPFTQRLKAGEVLVVRGRNGCGKSSLLKTIAGLLKPASGQVLWNDALVEKTAVLYIGHKRGLNFGLSVRDNVAFWARAYGQPDLIETALHYFDLEDIADMPLQSLSAGWQQRVALSRLVTVPASLWVLDEPAANLDEDGFALVNSIMQTRCEQGGIVVMATHAQVQGGGKIRELDLNDFGASILEAA